MSVGIAAAMVRATCKRQSIQMQVIPDEAIVVSYSFQDFTKILRHLAMISLIPLHQFTDSSCLGQNKIFIVCTVFLFQSSSSKSCNMAGTNTCKSCNAQRWETPIEGGDVCRTCFFRADLHVATHVIHCLQPYMFAVLDSALNVARILAHRIVFRVVRPTVPLSRCCLQTHTRSCQEAVKSCSQKKDTKKGKQKQVVKHI